MHGASAEESAVNRRGRGATAVRTSATNGPNAPAGFDPLALFPAESSSNAGKPVSPTRRAGPEGPAHSAGPEGPAYKDTRRRTSVLWLITGIAIGVAAGLAAPRVRIPVRPMRAASPPNVSLATAPPAPPAIDASNHDQTSTAPAPQVTRDAAASAAPAIVPAAPASGWLSISSPFTVQIFDGPSLIGGNGARVKLSAGRHDLRLVNASLGYDERRAVNIRPGRLSSLGVNAPKSTLDINALPWADVEIDGAEIGQTPLAHIPVTIGSHVVQFSHPQLGEQRRTVTVSSKGPNRVSVDLTR